MCNALNWPRLSNQILVIRPGENTQLKMVPCSTAVDELDTAIVIPIGKLVEDLQQSLIEGEAERQRPLALPPVDVAQSRSRTAIRKRVSQS